MSKKQNNPIPEGRKVVTAFGPAREFTMQELTAWCKGGEDKKKKKK